MIFNCDCGNTISKRKTNSWCKLSETIPRQMSVFFLFFSFNVSLSLSVLLHLSPNLCSRFPLGAHPDGPLFPKNSWTQKPHTLTSAQTQNYPMMSYLKSCIFFCMRRLCVRRAYLCLHRHCVESQSAEVTASMLYSLTGSQNSLCWGNCTLQDKQPTVSHSSASAPTANPGASLRGTAPQHPHSFRKGMWWSVLALMRLFSVIKYSTALFHRAVPPRHLS